MNPYITIRPEFPADFRQTEELVRESFWNVYQPGCYEHFILKHLRQSPDYLADLSQVMELEGQLIGQITFVKGSVDLDQGGRLPVLTLGPMAIRPDYQGLGLGKKLLDSSIDLTRSLGYGCVCLEGNPDFYGQSSFVPASQYGLRHYGVPEGEAAPFFLALELQPAYLAHAAGLYQVSPVYNALEGQEAAFAAYDATFPEREKQTLPGQLFS
ncbi:GNAT family N-acetyltransferase [Hutsoniella sourekii]|uniref:GNAT family N-acetyltransferase n=1 Tax=Hutsoniella sourekii TaxID=87650 RepID=UPI00048471FC|nr:N-acetyltransferase [Hutsoniella sourekii]